MYDSYLVIKNNITCFIKSTEITNQRFKLLFFYILNLIDALCTQFLIMKAPFLFQEINPVIEPIATDHQMVISKILIPLFLIIYWNIRYKRGTEKQRSIANILLNIIFIMYLLITLLHIFNFACYLIYI